MSNYFDQLLWPRCVADADIIVLSCFFLLLSFLFFSSPNLWMSTIHRESKECHDNHGYNFVSS